MRRNLLFVLLVVAAACAFGDPPPIQPIILKSAALQRDVRVNVLVPPNPVEGERFPVLYVLHGAWGGPDDWPKAKEGAPLAQLMPKHRMILVFPDGGQFGWYVDSPLEPASQYETHFVKELIPAIDAQFPTVAKREARGIMGLSMGGHGAITLAEKHPDLFGSASSMSGILNLTAHPKSWEIAKRLGPMEQNRSVWEANSALQLAANLKTANVRILADCGTSDVLGKQTGALEDGRAFHERMMELGIPHIWQESEGGHDWDYWTARLPKHVEFHQAVMAGETAGLSAEDAAHYKELNERFENEEETTVAPPAAATPAPKAS